MDNQKLIPLAVIIAGSIITVSMLYSRDLSLNFFQDEEPNEAEVEDISEPRPEEPMLGDPEAPVVFIEYSDTECPFSLEFKKERDKIISSYGESGEIAWIYRTVSSINETSMEKALAIECVAEEAPDHRYWRFLENVQTMEIPDEEQAEENSNILSLTMEAEKENISKKEIAECIQEATYADRIKRNTQEILAVGAEATPFTIIFAPQKISGSQEAEINSTLEEIPVDKFTIPPDNNRIYIKGLVPGDLIIELIEILIP
ncbi:MAG: DsbA family protein [Candidatus Paceibacterota bacterium]